MAKHDWVDAKVAGIPSILSMEAAINVVRIMVGIFLEWSVSGAGGKGYAISLMIVGSRSTSVCL